MSGEEDVALDVIGRTYIIEFPTMQQVGETERESREQREKDREECVYSHNSTYRK